MKFMTVYMLAVIALLQCPFDTKASKSNDYCAPSLCDGAKHIACKNYGKFASRCGPDAHIQRLSNELKQYILDLHNKYRDKIASGAVEPYEKAARMATFTWDDELARFATHNVRACLFESDECRNTDEFKIVGQTVDQTISEIQSFGKPKYVIKMMIDRWFRDHKNGDMSYIKKYRPHDENQRFERFAQLMLDEAYTVGCAMARAIMNDNYVTLFTCNYSAGIILGDPIYKASKKSASNCETGTNDDYPSLCSEDEIYDNPKYYNK